MKSFIADLESKCSVYQSVQQFCQGNSKPDLTTLPITKAKACDQRLPSGLQVSIYRSAGELPNEWDELLGIDQYFLSRRYLQNFETYRPEELDFAYMAIYKEECLLAVMSFQLLTFNTVRQVRSLEIMPEDNGWPLLRKQLLRAVLGNIDFNLIISGATQFSGEHGLAYDESRLTAAELPALMEESIHFIAQVLKQQGWRPHAVLIKDYYQPLHLEEHDYHPFPFMPNMTMEIRPEWNTVDDYLDNMKSKYRVRARRSFKKAESVEVREFSSSEIIQHEEAIHQLYKQVEEKADFSMIRIPRDYFTGLKESMPGKMRLFAYLHNGQLIGFFTTLRNGPELEAHFIGLDEEANYRFQLYLNMLYKMVEVAIEEGVEKLIFARTASAIKSSVGAVPEQMHCYMKHFSPLMNAIFPKIVDYLEPREDWKQRHPFGK